MILSRRSFLVGLVAAPVIIRPGILMPVRPLVTDRDTYYWYLQGEALPLPEGAEVRYGHMRFHAREVRLPPLNDWRGVFGSVGR